MEKRIEPFTKGEYEEMRENDPFYQEDVNKVKNRNDLTEDEKKKRIRILNLLHGVNRDVNVEKR